MTNDTFKSLIEAPVFRIETEMDTAKSSKEYDKLFLGKMRVKSVIARTTRLTLQYPEFAKEYLESLPKATMDNIPTATKNENKNVSVCNSTIDEAPMAYKPIEEIIECVEPTVDIITQIRPVYNFKAK